MATGLIFISSAIYLLGVITGDTVVPTSEGGRGSERGMGVYEKVGDVVLAMGVGLETGLTVYRYSLVMASSESQVGDQWWKIRMTYLVVSGLMVWYSVETCMREQRQGQRAGVSMYDVASGFFWSMIFSVEVVMWWLIWFRVRLMMVMTIHHQKPLSQGDDGMERQQVRSHRIMLVMITLVLFACTLNTILFWTVYDDQGGRWSVYGLVMTCAWLFLGCYYHLTLIVRMDKEKSRKRQQQQQTDTTSVTATR